VGGDLELLREIAVLFLDECPRALLEIHQAVVGEDAAKLENAAHSLKGSARAIGAWRTAEAAERATAQFRDVYAAKGWGAGMAAFIAMTSWRGEFTEDYFAQPAPDPAQFGMPTGDDGARDDPLLSDRSRAVSSYRPDFDALAATPTRIVIALGEESAGTFTGRTSVSTAELLGQEATVFPSHHGGFMGGDSGYAGQPEAFARKLRAVLTESN